MALLKTLAPLALKRPRNAAPFESFLRVRAEVSAAQQGVFELDVYDIVDPMGENFWFGTSFVSAKDVRQKLKDAGPVSLIQVRINSVGGDAFDGTAIYNLLKDHPARVEVHVDGICASIASIIAMAGDAITMGDGTWMMIHCPYNQLMAEARADDLRKAADTLDKMADAMATVYANRTGNSKEECLLLMQDETWMTADEALEQKFCTAVSAEPLPAADDLEDEESEEIEAMVASLAQHYAHLSAGALTAMKKATRNYSYATAAAAAAALRPRAEEEDKDKATAEVEDLKAGKKKAEDDLKKATDDKVTLNDELLSLKKALKDAEDKIAEFKKDPPDDDGDEDSTDAEGKKAEAQALAKLGLSVRALTGAKDLISAEKEIARIVAQGDRLQQLEGQMAHLGRDRHLARVSECIAKGTVLPARKDYMTEGLGDAKDDAALSKAVATCKARLDSWLEATGGEALGPVASAEHRTPDVKPIDQNGKGTITAEDRSIAKALGTSEADLQAAADLRAQRFGK